MCCSIITPMGDVNGAHGPAAEAPRTAGSGGRRERARLTRQRIAESALRLFSANGYAATTMDAIAHGAGVAVQTVYFTFHTKAEVLIEAIRIAGGGPGEPGDVMSRAWVQEAFAASDGGRRLALIVEHGTEIYRRLAPMFRAISAAASVDPDVDEAWNEIVRGRRQGMRRMTQEMEDRGELRLGLGAARAADIMSSVNRHDVYLAFTVECGWSVEEYKAWAYATLARQLLRDSEASAALAAGSSATAGMSFETALLDLPVR